MVDGDEYVHARPQCRGVGPAFLRQDEDVQRILACLNAVGDGPKGQSQDRGKNALGLVVVIAERFIKQ